MKTRAYHIHTRSTSCSVQLLRACTHVLCAGEGKPSSVSRGALSNKRVCALHSRMNLMQLDNSAEYTKWFLTPLWLFNFLKLTGYNVSHEIMLKKGNRSWLTLAKMANSIWLCTTEALYQRLMLKKGQYNRTITTLWKARKMIHTLRWIKKYKLMKNNIKLNYTLNNSNFIICISVG